MPTNDGDDGERNLPEVSLIAGLVSGIDDKGETFVRDRNEINLTRAADFQQAALDYSGVGASQFLDRVAASERLSDLFWNALSSAQRAGLMVKRKALGAIVGSAVRDEMFIERSELFFRALAELERPDIVVLSAIAHGTARTGFDGKPNYLSFRSVPGARTSVLHDDVAEDSNLSVTIRRLQHLALLMESSGAEFRPSAFGHELVDWLEEAGGAP